MSTASRQHVPQRTCVACGRKRAKHELLRLLPDGEAGVQWDHDQRGEGRGAYLCPDADCLVRVKQARLQKAFRWPLASGAWNPHALAAEILPRVTMLSRGKDRSQGSR